MEVQPRALSCMELQSLKDILIVKKNRSSWIKKIAQGNFATVYKFHIKKNRGSRKIQFLLALLFSRFFLNMLFVFVVCCLQPVNCLFVFVCFFAICLFVFYFLFCVF